MPAHRFKFEIGGETLHGLAFGSETELEDFLAGRPIQLEAKAQPPHEQVPPAEVRLPGRPSFDSILIDVVTRLSAEINACNSLRSAARLVQRTLAIDLDAGLIPSLKTVERFITEHRAGQNQGQNLGQNSPHVRMARTGGSQ